MMLAWTSSLGGEEQRCQMDRSLQIDSDLGCPVCLGCGVGAKPSASLDSGFVHQDGGEPYSALVSSAYARRDECEAAFRSVSRTFGQIFKS